jgi:hypothetical protein
MAASPTLWLRSNANIILQSEPDRKGKNRTYHRNTEETEKTKDRHSRQVGRVGMRLISVGIQVMVYWREWG